MKVVIVGEPPFLDELTVLAKEAGHTVSGFLQSEMEEDDLASADLGLAASVFSPDIVDDLDEALPAASPLLYLAFATSTTYVSFGLSHPERVVGWGSVPPLKPDNGEALVEVARSLSTNNAAFEAACDFWKSLGLEPVEVCDGPGLVRARALCCLINEAVSALADGVASAEDIDAAMKLGNNYPQGLLAWADALGLDRVLEVLRGLAVETGDPAYRPHPLLRRKVWANQLGKETGQGFFKH